jgi:hypothetical protein
MVHRCFNFATFSGTHFSKFHIMAALHSVKLFLSLTKHHAMKIYVGAARILNLDARWR